MAVISHDMDNFNLAVNTHVDPRRVEAVPVGDDRQLLVDDFFLAMGRGHEQYPRNIAWTLGNVDKHGAPLFEGEQPWEESSAWLTVLKDEGRYRMWYNSGHPEARSGLFLSYAESDDGVAFTRRELGLVEVAGSARNNVVFDGGLAGVSPESGNVFIDPNALDGERYKLIYTDWWGPEISELPFTHNVGMLRGAASPDGLSWTRYYDNFLGKYCDSQNSACWDHTLGRYVVYHRATAEHASLSAGGVRIRGERRGRAVGRLESVDYRNWESTGIALQADFHDTLDTDIYNSAYARYPYSPNLHFLFPSFYRHYEGTFEVQVCTSRDNLNWFRANRDTFVPLGAPGEFDCFIVSVAPGFVAIDDDTLALYYRSGDGPHGGSKPIELGYQPSSRVSRVTFKRDRIIGIEAGAEQGQFLTRPLTFSGSQLQVNLEALGPEAELTAQLVSVDSGEPIDGCGFDDCRPIRSDALDGVIAWGGRDRLPAELAGRPVQLHVRLRSARLYAFQFANANA